MNVTFSERERESQRTFALQKEKENNVFEFKFGERKIASIARSIHA